MKNHKQDKIKNPKNNQQETIKNKETDKKLKGVFWLNLY